MKKFKSTDLTIGRNQDNDIVILFYILIQIYQF